jgi:hypothetical protein
MSSPTCSDKYKVLFSKTEGQRPLGRPHKKDNIKTGSERNRLWYWVHLFGDTVADSCEQGNESSSYITGRNVLTIRAT